MTAMRLVYRLLGLLSVAVGVVGIFLPLLPTVPFMLLAAFLFARSDPAWEQWLLDHPRLGPPIVAWRAHGAIGRRAKTMAVIGLAGSATMGLILLASPWRFIPLGVAIVCSAFILTRPSRGA